MILGRIAVIGALAACLAPCAEAPSSGTSMLFDFESEAALDRLNWHCGALYSLSPDHATHGARSLKMEVFPSPYPGFDPLHGTEDWRGYDELGFDVFNPAARAIRIGLRIDDKKKPPLYEDRFNRSVELNPGANHVTIPLSSLVTSDGKRRLDLAHIRKFQLFIPYPAQSTTLYIDAVALARNSR